MSIKEEVEKSLGIRVKDFRKTFKTLDKQGKFTNKVAYELIVVILEHLENSEKV